MIDTEYLTQMLLSSTKNEDPVVFFRRIQKAIWESLFLFFPEVERSGKDIYEALPFEDFSKRHYFHTGLDPQDYVEGRYLETARLCSQGLTLSRARPSAIVKDASDNTEKTEICIESAKMPGLPFKEGVRFSYATRIIYQPFAGFYPLVGKDYRTPDLIDKLLQLPDIKCEFFPRIDKTEGHVPEFSYPVSSVINVIEDQASAGIFLRRLNDPARPIPFVVFMGGACRLHEEAEWLLPRVFTKCYIYIVRNSELLHGIEKVVEGINLRENFHNCLCRVFFPFGTQYLHDDFANPNYRVSMFKRNRWKSRDLIMNGLLRFFDLNEPGWNRTQRDVHMRQLDLQEERQFQRKVEEVEDSRDALVKKQAIIDTILDARKRENEERKLFEEDNAKLIEANRSLESENKSLMDRVRKQKYQIDDLNTKLTMWQGETSAAGEIDFKVRNLFPHEVNDHVAEVFEKAFKEMDASAVTRRRQILESLMKVCKKTGTLDQRRKVLERILRGNKGLTDNDFAELQRMGFTCEHGGKHDKISLGELSYSVSCMPGDKSRHWKNQIAGSRKVFF